MFLCAARAFLRKKISLSVMSSKLMTDLHSIDGRPTTNDATCGLPVWLAGSLHDGGIRSVRSPLRRAALLAAPIATPLQGGFSGFGGIPESETDCDVRAGKQPTK